MPVLALDTSAAASAAVVDDTGRTLATRSSGETRRHAEALTPLLDAVLAEAGVSRTDLTAVVAGTGPAPFTGLRVGLVTARTLGLALGIPVHGVSSLDAVALAAARDLDPGAEVLVVTDARRKEVYSARYRVAAGGAVELLDGPAVETPAALAARGLPDGAVVVGAGTALYPELLPGAPAEVDPADLARVALARLAVPGTTLPTEPLYLRRPDAVPPAAGKRALG
ncbi:tRNA (adenosine(37)-N6)-threonylcarbamoyltransferase complex dimerization subunit type 1 TsaB [Cellulomonas hominis]|uniref:tRNA (adenosine(37)-N6)-threonylcarbamoyltransferase complex dimerization subunit type 1 TsaB n=1 Tax=Cellulomonas hominis TaxID=156981 RepID=UPI001C124F1E|nr:tRNA (adenosine(37)-N6)-threonylcarbamoyltransferase complex dimerization subunit type 1 TsaB [Cellulomonas hominis]MBU5421687.1 tRNA (adenosine(37)-N6)-threonylcarbamoyltransferase complex dimerization subunit type 1 TsaB [Cellulomonas hominis]